LLSTEEVCRVGERRASRYACWPRSDALAGVEGRKSVILVPEGFVSEPQQRVSGHDQAARRANVVIYFLNARGGAG
jgi:hypothetical protein